MSHSLDQNGGEVNSAMGAAQSKLSVQRSRGDCFFKPVDA
jgi:hypothetical protein